MLNLAAPLPHRRVRQPRGQLQTAFAALGFAASGVVDYLLAERREQILQRPLRRRHRLPRSFQLGKLDRVREQHRRRGRPPRARRLDVHAGQQLVARVNHRGIARGGEQLSRQTRPSQRVAADAQDFLRESSDGGESGDELRGCRGAVEDPSQVPLHVPAAALAASGAAVVFREGIEYRLERAPGVGLGPELLDGVQSRPDGVPIRQRVRDPPSDRPRARGGSRAVAQEPQQGPAVLVLSRSEHLELPEHVGREVHLAGGGHRAERGRQEEHAVQAELSQPVEGHGDGARRLLRQVQRVADVAPPGRRFPPAAGPAGPRPSRKLRRRSRHRRSGSPVFVTAPPRHPLHPHAAGAAAVHRVDHLRRRGRHRLDHEHLLRRGQEEPGFQTGSHPGVDKLVVSHVAGARVNRRDAYSRPAI